MCPACAAMAAMIAAGVASSGALSLLVAKTFTVEPDREAQTTVIQTEIKESSHHGNQRN